MAFSTASTGEAAPFVPDFQSGRSLSRKLFLTLTAPSEGDTMADAERLLSALRPEYPEVALPYYVLKRDYPAFREQDWRITVSLVFTGKGWQVASIEIGRAHV